jgi:Putative phage tail protein
MSGLFGGSSNTETQEIYSGIQVSSSILGQPLPYVAGRQRVPFNLSWYGNFQVLTSNAGGGKGGGGSSTKQYSYSAAFIAALCLGPITGLFQIWHDKALETLTFENLAVAYGGAIITGSISGTTLTVTKVQGYVTDGVLTGNGVFLPTTVTGQLTGPAGGVGTYTVSHSQTVASTAMFVAQPAWSGYPSGTPSGQIIPYDHLAYVASSAYNLGSSAGMPNLTFEVEGVVPGYSDANSIFDADPSAVLPNYLLDGVIGALANYPGTPLIIGSSDAPLTGTTNSYQAYCMAMGLLTSPYEYTQRQATDFTAELLQCTNSDVFLSYGTLKVFPYCDQAVSATVAGTAFSYTPNLTPVYILGDDDYVVDNDEPPVKLSITAQSDTYNEVNVEILDRSNYYNAAPVNCSDLDDIAKYGPRLASSLSWHQITQATVGKTAGQLWLQKQLRETNRYLFKTRRDYSLLEPGIDFVGLNDAHLGLVNQVCQVESVEVGEDQTLTFTVIEMPGVTRSTAQFNWAGAQGYFANYATDPGVVQTPLIFQMPPIPAATSNGITLGLAVCGQTANAAWLGCDVYASLDGGTTYQLIGRMPEACRYGTLTANLPQVSDPDTTSTLSIALANTTLQLSTAVTHADADTVQTPILVFAGGTAEVMSYGTAALVSAGNYNLTYLRRGLYGSLPEAQSSGADFVRLDGAIFQVPVDPGMAGQTIFFKFVSFNTWQRPGPQTLSSSTAYSYTVPSGTTVVGDFLAGGSATSVGTSAYKMSTGATAWDSSVYSRQGYTNGCSISCYPSLGPENGGVMVGLTLNPLTSNSYTNLAYALYLTGGNTIQIYEAGVAIGTFFGAYSQSTLVNVTYDGKHVSYWINGALVRSVPISNLTLFAQICFFGADDGVFGIDFSPNGTAVTPFTIVPMSTTVAAAGTKVVSNSTGTNGWGTKNFQSKESISNGCFVSASVNPLADAQFFGLSLNPTAGDTTGLVYTLAGWYPHSASSTCHIMFNGAIVGASAPYATLSDVFSIAYDGHFFYWYRNSTLVLQLPYVTTAPLFLFGDFFEDGEGFSNVVFAPYSQSTPVMWIARGTCTVSDESVNKPTGSNAFDSDAYSTTGFPICHIVAKANFPTLEGGIALVPQTAMLPALPGFAGYTHYLFFDPGNTLTVLTSGTVISSGTPYLPTDLVAITYDGTTVSFWRNGTLITSVSDPGQIMYGIVDVYSVGNGINSVEFGPGGIIPLGDTGQLGLNAATSTGSVTTTTASCQGTLAIPSNQESITVGPFPYPTTVVLDANASYTSVSAGFGTPIFMHYGISSVSGTLPTDAVTQFANPSPSSGTNQKGVLAVEAIFALAANTTQTYYFVTALDPSGVIGSGQNFDFLTLKYEVIKR